MKLLIGFVALGLLISGAFLANLHFVENFANPELTPNAITLAKYYFYTEPTTTDRPEYGNGKIKMTIFSNPQSESSRLFIREVYPELEAEFFSKQKLKLIHRNHIELTDIKERNDKFKYAISLSCVSTNNRQNYHGFYLKLMNGTKIEDAAKDLGIDMKQLEACMQGEVPNEIYEDAADTKRLGMIGVDPRTYIGIEGIQSEAIDGVPNYPDLRRRIRNYQTQIGE